MLYPPVYADLEAEAKRANVTVSSLARIILSEWIRGRKGESTVI